MAADWEWQKNLNINAARKLLQRGLRFVSGVQDIWIQYFKLEFLFLIKMRERHRVLGILPDSGIDSTINEGIKLDPEFHDNDEKVTEMQKAAELVNYILFILICLVGWPRIKWSYIESYL